MDSRTVIPRRKRASSQVIRLVSRLRELVAEQRAIEDCASAERLETLRREIDRLQGRLAEAVRCELNRDAPVPLV